jgi:hypothetical protein
LKTPSQSTSDPRAWNPPTSCEKRRSRDERSGQERESEGSPNSHNFSRAKLRMCTLLTYPKPVFNLLLINW